MALPGVKVEVAFDSGYLTPAASRTWTDISAYVEGSQPLTITRGRADETSEVQPSRLGLTLDNADGRFTPRLTTGAYYPNVKKWRPIRVTATYNAVDYVRFTGYVAEWPMRWPDGSDAVAEIAITGVSRMARMGRGGEARSVVEEEILDRYPKAYYTLGEPEGATYAVDTSGNQAPSLTQAGGGADVVFGNATGPGTDGLTAAEFSGRNLQALGIDLGSPAWVAFVLSLSIDAASVTGNLISSIQGIVGVAPYSYLVVDYDATTDTLSVLANSSGGGGSFSASATVAADGARHTLMIVLKAAGGHAAYLDGVTTGWSTSGAANAMSPLFGSTTRYAIGDTMTCVLAHAAILGDASAGTALDSADAAAIHDAMETGFAGESSGARIARLAAYSGIPAAEVATDTGSATIGLQDLTGKTSLQAMSEVVITENGVLYDAKDGTLTFGGRTARYNVASSFTLDCATQEVEADLEPRDDDQFLVNDVTATANGTPAGRVINQTSIDDNGYYREALETVTDDVNDAFAAARWKVAKGADPEPRYASVVVDVTNSSTAQAAAVLAAEIGDRFTLVGLPEQAPDSSVDLFVEGYEEVITSTSHTVKFNTSPAAGYDVWQLARAGYSELGSTTRIAF